MDLGDWEMKAWSLFKIKSLHLAQASLCHPKVEDRWVREHSAVWGHIPAVTVFWWLFLWL